MAPCIINSALTSSLRRSVQGQKKDISLRVQCLVQRMSKKNHGREIDIHRAARPWSIATIWILHPPNAASSSSEVIVHPCSWYWSAGPWSTIEVFKPKCHSKQWETVKEKEKTHYQWQKRLLFQLFDLVWFCLVIRQQVLVKTMPSP